MVGRGESSLPAASAVAESLLALTRMEAVRTTFADRCLAKVG
jgi:hypothetical protein